MGADSKKKKKRDAKFKKLAKLTRRMRKMYERAQSDACEVRNSQIHGRGVYATRDIDFEEEVIEYVGEFVNKEESTQRAWDQVAYAEETGDAAVYIFTLNDDWDIDGNVPWNDAKYINHSCDPNCEAYMTEDSIMIYALRDINEGEELTFDYGFDIECFLDHPCRCGSAGCVGYIVARDQWKELKKRLQDKKNQSE